MSMEPHTIRDYARRLIASEAARAESQNASNGGAGRVCDRLRVAIAKLAGIAGFRSLLSRALALAKSEVVSLNQVRVREDGSLEGVDGTWDDPGGDGETALVANLLGLLVTFIGEPLTLQLVREAWPEAAADETDGRVGGRP